MSTASLNTRPVASPRARTLALPGAPWLRRLGLTLIVLLSAALNFANLSAIGYANQYYTAGVASMLQSWSNFFFVAAEPGGSVSIDKPPVGFWLQAISAYFLGVNGFAMVLPEIICAILSVIVVYHLVRRSWGTMAGLFSALALAVTPVVVAASRNNTIDSSLIFTLLLAAWAFIKATESRKLRWLMIGAALVGVAFNIKMMAAYLPLPAFYALYFLGSSEPLRRKIGKLVATTALLVAVSFSWAVAVDLTPASQRPYVGSSGNNSEISLIVGYNGIQRLLGMGSGTGGARTDATATSTAANTTPNSITAQSSTSSAPSADRTRPNGNGGPGGNNGGGMFNTGQKGILRLFTSPLSNEMSWLLPFGLFSIGLLAFRSRIRWPLEKRHQAAVLWGGWLLTGATFFSVAGFFHSYYLTILGAPLAALVGIGVAELWRMRKERMWLAIGLLLLAAAGTLGFQLFTVASFAGSTWWMAISVALFVAGAAALLFAASKRMRRTMAAGFIAVALSLMVTPGIWSGLTTAYSNQSLPAAYSGTSNRGGMGGGMGTPPNRASSQTGSTNTAAAASTGTAGQTNTQPGGQGGGTSSLNVNQTLIDYLQANTQGMQYMMAVPSSGSGEAYVLATGRGVLYVGGFNGGDTVVTVSGLKQLVAEGKLRYIYWSTGGNGMGASNSNASEIAQWLQSSGKVVDLGSTSGSTPSTGGPGNQQLVLYDVSTAA